MRNIGLSVDLSDELETEKEKNGGEFCRKLTIREKLAIKLTEAILKDSNNIPPELSEELSTHFSDEEKIELVMFCGYINTLNWFNNVFGIDYNDDYKNMEQKK